jgi:hypothetical protein
MTSHVQQEQSTHEHIHAHICGSGCSCASKHSASSASSELLVSQALADAYVEDVDFAEPEPEPLLDDAAGEMAFLVGQKFKEVTLHTKLDCSIDRKMRHDLDLQLHHKACCWSGDPDRFGLLEVVKRKVTYVCKDGKPGYWNNKAKWDDYDMLATLFVTSTEDRCDRVAFALCGFPRQDGMRSSCNDVLFCPRCCFHRRTGPMLAEFGNLPADLEASLFTFTPVHESDHQARLVYKNFEQEEWQQIAKRGLAQPFQHYGIPFERSGYFVDDCVFYAEIFRRVIAEAVDEGYILGAIGSFELAVRFLPLGVLPHLHLIVFTRGLCKEHVQEIRRRLKQAIRKSRKLEYKLQPDVSVLRLRESKDYRAALGYCFKRLKIEKAYAHAAHCFDYEKEKMELLNRDFDWVFDNIRLVYLELGHPVYRYGICHPLHSDYCFTVTDERMEKREAEAERRKEMKKREEAEAKELGQPLHRRRKKTRKEARQRRSDKAAYTRFLGDGSVTQPAVKPQRPRRWRKAVNRKQSTATAGPDNPVDAYTSPAPIEQSARQVVESKASASSAEKREKLRAVIRKIRERERASRRPIPAAPIPPSVPLFVYDTSPTLALASHDDPSSYLDEY